MPRIIVTTNLFLNKAKKHQIHEEFKAAIEIIPCENGAFLMTEFRDDTDMLFGDVGMDEPCASVEAAVVEEVFDKYDKSVMEQVLCRFTETIMRNTGIPEEKIFACYRNSKLWCYKRKDIIGSLVRLNAGQS